MDDNRRDARRKVQIALVDDHPVVRLGLASLISRNPQFEICGEADDVASGLRLLGKDSPDVMIVDLALRTGNGLDLIRRIKARGHPVRILVASMYDESLYAERAVRAGASGYINKQEVGRKIVSAIEHVLEGKVYLSDQTSSRIVMRVMSGSSPGNSDPVSSLSDRELEVFRQIGKSLSTVQIAANLHVSVKTIETYRQRIKQKLGLETAAELLGEAVRWSLENS